MVHPLSSMRQKQAGLSLFTALINGLPTQKSLSCNRYLWSWCLSLSQGYSFSQDGAACGAQEDHGETCGGVSIKKQYHIAQAGTNYYYLTTELAFVFLIDQFIVRFGKMVQNVALCFTKPRLKSSNTLFCPHFLLEFVIKEKRKYLSFLILN